MIYNYLPTAFPWYDKKEKQTRFKAKTEFSFPHLISPEDSLLSFQFRKTATGEMPTSWKIYDLEDNLITDLSGYIMSLKVRALGFFDYFYWADSSPMIIGGDVNYKLKPGCYYMKMEFPGSINMFSETFRVPLDSFSALDLPKINYLRLTWKNYGPIIPIYYPTDEAAEFYNEIYIDSRITSSEPEIEEEVTQDGNNKEIPYFRRADLKYRITFFSADYLKVALYCMQLHDSISLVTQNGLESGQLKDIDVSGTAEEGGFASTMDIVFQENLVITSKSCPEEFALPDCPEMPDSETLEFLVELTDAGYVVSAVLPTNIYAANIYRNVSEPEPHSDFIKKASKTELFSGVLVPLLTDTTGFYLELLSFNCIVGNSDDFNL